MTQISYSEAFDPYHTIYRFIRSRDIFGYNERFHFDMVRILDFYLLFPFCIQDMSLMSSDRTWRKVSKSYAWMEPYGGLRNETSVFTRMEVFQEVAMNTLANMNLVSPEDWKNKIVRFQETELNEEIISRANQANSQMQDVIEILEQIKDRYPLRGKGGLKDRSGLLEFRYDAL